MKKLELGQTAKIHCKATGSKKIYWIKENDEELPEDVNDVNGTLHFNNVVMDHRGTYICFASNDKITINASIEVEILPSFEIEPEKNIEIVEMQSFLLHCVGFGTPNPIVQWDFDGNMIESEKDERMKIFENGSLLLKEVRQDDSGIYACTIGNSVGLKRKESSVIVRPMDSHTSFEDSEETEGRFFSKAVLMTCLFSVIYISLVIALMFWCRKKRMEQNANENTDDKKIDDTASDGEEKEVRN